MVPLAAVVRSFARTFGDRSFKPIEPFLMSSPLMSFEAVAVPPPAIAAPRTKARIAEVKLGRISVPPFAGRA